MAAMMATHYHAAHGAHYGYVAPPTPPMDETRNCSLPSISNLLGLADHGSPTTETSPSSFHSHSRPNSSHNAAAAASMMTARLPLTPPMSSYDSYQSPPSKPVSQLPPSAGPGYYFDMEAEARQMVPRMAMQPTAYQPQFATPTYAVPSYYPTMQPTPPPQGSISGLFYQRPLPHNFPPLPISMSMGGPGTNPWQHHHYIAPSASGSYQQSQDRYICQTCGKAFSRPSSLRIHSHSHTGEKPFKCPHPGCGKAFSVRSNMKRHERGCHNYETSSTSGSSSIGA